MPPARRYSKSLKKRTYRKKSPVTTTTVKRVLNKMAETKAIIYSGEEQNFGTTLTSPTTWYSLNNINKGTESHNRIGNKINPTYLDIRGSVMASANKQMYHKIFILQQNKQSDPLTDLLENNTGAFAPVSHSLSSIYDRVNTTKYKVLGTRVLKTGTSNGSNSEQLTQMFHFKIPLKGVMEFQEDESICQKKRTIILCYSREAANDTGLGLAVEWTWNSKLYYKDF